MPSRYVCNVLDEMRDMLTTYNFSPLLASIEEVQQMVNRMESQLEEYSAVPRAESILRNLKTEKKQLELDIFNLESKKKELEYDAKVSGVDA